MLACKESCIPVNKDFTARLGTGIPFDKLDLKVDPEAAPANPPAEITVPPVASAAGAIVQPEGSEVKIVGRLIPGVTRPQDGARLEISLITPPGWHVYAFADRDNQPGSKPTLIAFNELSGLKAGRPVTSTSITTDSSVPEFGTMRYYAGPVTWEVPIEIPADAKPGEYPIRGVIAYQACETREDGLGSCELPKGITFEAKPVVGDTPGSAAPQLIFGSTTYKDAAAVAASWAPNWSNVAHTPARLRAASQ